MEGSGRTDPLASLFAMNNDFSKLRSPMPKATMSGLQPADTASAPALLGPQPSPAAGVGDARVQQDFQRLCKSSPMPKVIMGLLKPGPSHGEAAVASAGTIPPPPMPPPPPLASLSLPRHLSGEPAPRISKHSPGGTAASTGAVAGHPACSLSATVPSAAATSPAGPAAAAASAKNSAHRGMRAAEPAALVPSRPASEAATPAPTAASAPAVTSAPIPSPAVSQRKGNGKRPMHLTGWYLRRLGRTSSGETLLAVEGLRCDPHAGSSANKPWHSTAIVDRVTARELRTSSGSTCVSHLPRLATAAHTAAAVPAPAHRGSDARARP